MLVRIDHHGSAAGMIEEATGEPEALSILQQTIEDLSSCVDRSRCRKWWPMKPMVMKETLMASVFVVLLSGSAGSRTA